MRCLLILAASLSLWGQAAPTDYFATCGATYSQKAGVACSVALNVTGSTYVLGSLVQLRKSSPTFFVDGVERVGSAGKVSLWISGGVGIPTGAQVSAGSINPGAFLAYSLPSGVFFTGGCRVLIPLSITQVQVPGLGARVTTQTFIGIGMHFSKGK